MTSTGSAQNVPAPKPSAPIVASYASAASASGKTSSSSPVISTGSSTAPVVATSSTLSTSATPGNARTASVSPLNGSAGSSNLANTAIMSANSSSAAQNGGNSSTSKPVTPAVPAVINGSTADHARSSSVTIVATAPNGYVSNGVAAGPQPKFGFESPAMGHSSPQPNTAGQRIPSPAHSPIPIPQPAASGGRPPSMTSDGGNMKFGSFGGDGDHNFTHMPANLPAGNSSPHLRRGSSHSVHSDMGNPAGRDSHMSHGPGNHGPHHGGPSGRGGFSSGNRGRGGYNNHNGGHNHFNGQSMPFQPQGQYPRGPPSQGPRNTGAPPFQPRNVMNPGYGPGSPQTSNSRASPAVPPILPSGTPQMQGVVPVPGGSPYMSMQYSTPTGFPPQPNVNIAPTFLPSNNQSNMQEKFDYSSGPSSYYKGGGSSMKKMARGGGKKLNFKYIAPPRAFNSESKSDPKQEKSNKGMPHRNSKRWMESEQSLEYCRSTAAEDPSHLTNNNRHRPSGAVDSNAQTGPAASLYPEGGPVPSVQQSHGPAGNRADDLSPITGNFDRLLTARKQNYPPFQQNYNMGYPAYQNMNPYAAPPPPQQGHGYQQHPYGAQQFVPPVAQPMSRTSSQAASERPNSSMGQVQTPSSAHASLAIPGGAQKPGTNFVKPKKHAIVIKNPQGETIDFNKKAAATPAPAVNPPVVSRTPPVVSSTPPPPPKSTTPSHARTDSAAGTQSIADQVRNEFKERVHKRAETPAEAESKAKDEAAAAAAAAAPAAAAPAETKVEQKKSEPVIVSSSPAPVAEVKTEVKAEAKTEVKTEVKTEAKAEASAPEKKDAPAADPPLDDDEEMERMIREMEEEEAKREAEEAAYNAKKKERDEAAKIKAEADRIRNAAENDRLLREQEAEMERLEEERERKRKEGDAPKPKTVTETLAEKISNISNSPDSLASKLGDLKINDSAKETAAKRGKPSALNLAPLNTKAVEPPQPSAALQSLKTARFLRDPASIAYPKGIQSPNPALNPAVNKKGNFKYDMGFLLQFKDVFVEKPSLDFDTQVKSLIGEEGSQRSGSRTPAGASSGRQGSRNASSAFNMGAMGSFNSKPLPPGTTSEQRFAMASGGLPRPNTGGIASFGRPGAAGFPGPSAMTRTPSASIGGGMPNSPRQGSRSARGSSRQAPHNAKAEAQAAKTMPLTQGMDLKPIVTSSTGWKPTSIGRAAAQTASGNDIMDPELVQRKVKAALNKMTPEKFDKISEQILTIALQSKDEEDGRTLRQVIQLTFEKATDEAYWASMYARFCKRMLDQMSSEIRDVTIKDKKGDIVSGGTLFRKYLLNRCQQEFERGWKIDLPEPKEGETKEMAMLSDEYYEAAAAKRRGLGLVQFIGELYKLGMLTERIMHECVRKLVDYEKTPDEAEIESLSKLLRTVGNNLDRAEKGRLMMDAYFERIKNIIDIPDLPSRLRFMLMDIVDLRNRNWVSNEDNKGPKTLQEVRQDVQAQQAQKAVENARTNSQRGAGGRPGQRGDPRQFAYNQPAPNQVGMDDLRRLKGGASRIASSGMPTLGPTLMFASRSNSGRRPGFARPGDDSSPASRTGTPPTRQDSNSVSHSNAFEALANVDTETPASPPSTAASPAITKASIDKDAGK